MKASLFALGFLLLAPFAARGEEIVLKGPAPASVGTSGSRHADRPGGLAHHCLGSLCAENLDRLTNDHVTVTIEGLTRNN